jgi:hypothetical protein
VHDRISKAVDREAEIWAYGAVDGRRGLKNTVPKVALAHLVLYWTHYKRHHEEKKMSRYMHPFRFVQAHYTQDIVKFGAQTDIDSAHLNSRRITERISNLRSLSPDVLASHFIPVLPHSMHVHGRNKPSIYLSMI